MTGLQGKKLILLADEAGIPLANMRNAFAHCGAEVVYAAIECFV